MNQEKTKYIPSIVTLTAGFVACIATMVYDYSTKNILLIVLGTLVVFFVVGLFIKVLADRYLVLPEEKEEEKSEKTEEKEENDEESDTAIKEKDASVEAQKR